MKKKNVIFISIITIVVLAVIIYFISIRNLLMNPNLIGKWNNTENYPLKLYANGRFTEGNRDDLKCDLWNCSGYDEGNYRIYKNEGKNIIIFNYGSYLECEYEYSIRQENEVSELILKHIRINSYSDECGNDGDKENYTKAK